MSEEQEVPEIDTEASEQEAAPVAEAPPAPQYDPDDEADARLFGWKSEAEWQGEKPAGYIDNPTEYMDRVKRSRIFKTMQDKLTEAERASKDTVQRLEAMSQKAIERQREQYEARLADISQQQRAAAETGDLEQYDKLERQKAGLKAPEPETPQQGPSPDVTAYMESESGAWLKNPILYRQAHDMIAARPDVLGKPAKDQLAFVEGEMRRMYPAYFPQPEERPKPKQTVDPGGLATSQAKPDAFSKLPSEAKAQFAQFVKQNVFKDTKADREEYAREFANASR